MPKTLLVGLDAACWEYLGPMLKAGQLPTLQRLIDSGSSGTLHSTMPPWTPTAWASIITGKEPGKHGIFDMMWRRPGSYSFSPTNASSRAGTPFWDRLNEHGVSVGLINVPFTYPPRPLKGFVVGGFGTPPSVADITYPQDILSYIENKFGPYEPFVEPQFLRSSSPQAILEKEKSHQTKQAQIAIELAQRFQVEVLVINLMLPDHANHKMPTMDLVHEAYFQSDRDLDDLIARFQPDNIMVISDHGSTRLKGDFLLNAWLRDHGYLIQQKNEPRARSLAFNWVLAQWLQTLHGWSGLPERAVRRLLRTTLFYLPQRVQEYFWNRIDKVIPFARDHVLYSDEPDYSQTPVFPGSLYSGLLYLNIMDREPTGVIHPEKRSALAKELARKLSAIQEPDTGLPLFTNVYTADEVYPFSTLTNTPDIILDSYDKGWNIRASKYVPIPEPTRNKYFVDVVNRGDYGWHSRDGVFILSGDGFVANLNQSEGNLVDIPATLLHLYDVPIPDDYDGQVLTEVLQPALSQRVIRTQPGDKGDSQFLHEETLSADETEELVSHLRALGYLD